MYYLTVLETKLNSRCSRNQVIPEYSREKSGLASSCLQWLLVFLSWAYIFIYLSYFHESLLCV